jgi:hypothetical protein
MNPDAILFGPGLVGGATHRQRVHEACAKLEPILGGKCWISEMANGVWFARRDHWEKRYYDTGHDKAGLDRYEWTDGPEGMKFGKLKEEG